MTSVGFDTLKQSDTSMERKEAKETNKQTDGWTDRQIREVLLYIHRL